jgi:hypothetical protein
VINATAIINQALQIAKCPGYVNQAIIALNAVLEELALHYDADTQRVLININVPADAKDTQQVIYTLPADYLRVNSIFYDVAGTTYYMVPITLDEYDHISKTPGETSFPTQYTTDLNANTLNIWPPPSLSLVLQMRYFRMPQDISDTSNTPWFVYQRYLIHEVATEMMKLTNDARWGQFEGAGQDMLRKFLRMMNDLEGKLNRVTKDPRFFRSGSNAKPTKYVVE